MNRSLSTITINVGKSGVPDSVISEITRHAAERANTTPEAPYVTEPGLSSIDQMILATIAEMKTKMAVKRRRLPICSLLRK